MTRNPIGHLTSDHSAIVKLGRVGWLAKGVVYVLAGGLALLVVRRSLGWSKATAGSVEASPTGAIKEVAQSQSGPLLLIALAVGLFLYAAWRAATVLLPGHTNAESLVMRVGYGISAIIYTIFGLTALALARSRTAKADGNEIVTDMTRQVLQEPTGRWLIGFVGAVVIATGLYRISKGLRSDVTSDINMSGMSPVRSQLTRRLGEVGEVGRGIAMGLIGFFLLRAAITFRAVEATGLDGALRRLASETWGEFVVAIVGIGLIAYGLFCLATFTRQRLQAP